MEKKLCKVYIFGNSLVEEDSLPIRIVDKLRGEFKGIEFVILDPSENLPEEEDFMLIDTVLGINEVKVIEDVDAIKTETSYSLHDFDLGFNLKLMKKLGKIKSVMIIGVPSSFSESKAFIEVKKVISSLVSKNG